MAHMHKWDADAMGWIPHEQPFSRPKPRQVNRHMLLRGLAEEVVYEELGRPALCRTAGCGDLR